MVKVALVETKTSRTDFNNAFDNAFEFDKYVLCSDSTIKKVLKKDVDIEIDINANEWQGKWFNSITCWKATLRNPGQSAAPQQPQTYYQGASSTAAPVQTAIPQPPVDFGEQKDDLPF